MDLMKYNPKQPFLVEDFKDLLSKYGQRVTNEKALKLSYYFEMEETKCKKKKENLIR